MRLCCRAGAQHSKIDCSSIYVRKALDVKWLSENHYEAIDTGPPKIQNVVFVCCKVSINTLTGKVLVTFKIFHTFKITFFFFFSKIEKKKNL